MQIRSGKDPLEFASRSSLAALCHGSRNELLQGNELLKRPLRLISAPDEGLWDQTMLAWLGMACSHMPSL